MRQARRDAEFSEYVAAHQHRMLRTARLLTAGDEALAEDVVQTAMTKLYVAWPRVSATEDPVGYGFRTLTNAFLDERRRRFHSVERSAAVVPDQGVEGQAERVAVRESVLAALAALPPRQRAVVVLRHWLDLDTHTVAAALGCSEGTVKSQNSKALAHLREALPHLISEELNS